MQNVKRSIDDWMNWSPESQNEIREGTDRTDKTDESQGNGSSVSFVSCQLEAVPVGSTHGQDPELWQLDVELWLQSQCTFNDRLFSSVSSLYVDVCEWSLNQQNRLHARNV